MAETRTTSSTGGQKGTKLARFDLIPAGPLTELAEHYGRGARKYADHQWRKGYEWSKSIAALGRHYALFVQGYDYDVCSNDPDGCSFVDADGNDYEPLEPDTCFNHTGSHHMAAVAWHAFLLLEFKGEYPEHDDRYRPTGGHPADIGLDEVTLSEDSDLRDGPDYTWIAINPPKDCREALIRATQRLVGAYDNEVECPEDPHGADEVEYAQDMVDQAVKDYETLGPDAAVPDRTLGEGWGEAGWVDETQWAALKPIQDHVNRMVAALFDAQRISEAFAPGDGVSIPGAIYWNDPAPVNLANVEDAFEALSKTDFAQTLSTTFDVNLSPAAHRILFGIPDSDPRHFVVDTLGEASETLPAHGYVGEYRDMLRKRAPKI